MIKDYLKKLFEFLKKIKFIMEDHEFLTFANIFSFICGIIPALYTFCFFEPKSKILGFVYLVPILVIYLISLCSYFLSKKFPKITKVLSCVSNTFIIIYFQLIFGIFAFSFSYEHDIDIKCNKLGNYPMALKYMDVKSRVRHFPTKIPTNAKNIYFYAGIESFFGSKSLYLKFDIDKEYIEEELKKYKYIKVKPYKNLKDFEYRFFCDIKLDDYTLYVIGDKKSEISEKRSFPYHYGIAVNSKGNQILYYYENPD